VRKGQIFLNGRNVCRFWQGGGTQDRYYLSRAWIKERNNLVVFEELGVLPQRAELLPPEDRPGRRRRIARRWCKPG
jgi:hypothetical protein